jgi:hypothetical protein
MRNACAVKLEKICWEDIAVVMSNNVILNMKTEGCNDLDWTSILFETVIAVDVRITVLWVVT